MKSIKMFGKSVPLLAIVMVSLLAVGASAVLLTQYGTITGVATVSQSVLIDTDQTSVSDSFDIIAGGTKCVLHSLDNFAEVQAGVDFVTSYYPTIDVGDIETSYYKPLAVSYGETWDDVDVTITETPNWLTWTYTYPVSTSHTPKMTVAINYPTGFCITTYDGQDLLDSLGNPVDKTGDTWYYASDTDDIPVALTGSEDWVQTSRVANVLTVSIKKTAFGCVESFDWHGFANYDGLPHWIEITFEPTTVHGLVILRESLGSIVVLQPESTMPLEICYVFDVALTPWTYTITTSVNPASIP